MLEYQFVFDFTLHIFYFVFQIYVLCDLPKSAQEIEPRPVILCLPGQQFKAGAMTKVLLGYSVLEIIRATLSMLLASGYHVILKTE